MVRCLVLSVCMLFASLLVGCGPSPNSDESDPSANTSAEGDADVQAAEQFIGQGNYAEALPHLQNALGKPLTVWSKSDVLTAIGVCYFEANQLDKALEYHDKAIAEDPRNHKAHANKGIVYRVMQDYDKAAECYSTALALAPDYAKVHVNMGALQFVQGEYDKAIEHLERALELDDSDPVAHANLALAYASVDRFDEADEELKKAVIRGYREGEIAKNRIDQLRTLGDGNR